MDAAAPDGGRSVTVQEETMVQARKTHSDGDSPSKRSAVIGEVANTSWGS